MLGQEYTRFCGVSSPLIGQRVHLSYRVDVNQKELKKTHYFILSVDLKSSGPILTFLKGEGTLYNLIPATAHFGKLL